MTEQVAPALQAPDDRETHLHEVVQRAVAGDGLVYVGELPVRSPQDVWQRRARRLQERPGDWYQVLGEGRATVAASLERLASNEGGHFEVAQRTVKGEEQPKVYARWVADEGSGG